MSGSLASPSPVITTATALTWDLTTPEAHARRVERGEGEVPQAHRPVISPRESAIQRRMRWVDHHGAALGFGRTSRASLRADAERWWEEEGRYGARPEPWGGRIP